MNALTKTKLIALSWLAPQQAGQLATKLFTQSRNAANPYRKAFPPIGASVVSVAHHGRKVQQYYLWGNSGDIVLLVHGWGAECGSMFSLAAHLVKQGYRVAAFDAPAHGSSEGEFASMSEYVADTQLILDELSDKGKVSRVIAHSLGGIVAMAAIAERSQIEKITLIAAPYSLSDVLDIWSKHVVQLSDKIRHKILAQLLKDNGVPVSHWDLGLHSKKTQADILVVHATDDRIVNCHHAQKICQSIAHTQLKTVDNLGHIKILSSPIVYDAISAFFGVPRSLNNET